MKYATRLLSLLILVSATVFFANCGGDDSPSKSEQQVQFEKLKFSWTLQSVKLDGVSTGNAAEQFETGTLSVSGNFTENGEFNYTLDASPNQVDASPWPPAGKWKFGSPATSTIIRLDSDINASYSDVTMGYAFTNGDKTLTVTIGAYNGESFVVAKTASVEGDWVFTFTRP